jgi:hypothetical protein
MGYQTSSGVTVKTDQNGRPYSIIGSDGKAYDSLASAEKASEIYNKSSSMALESASLDLQAKRNASKNNAANSAVTQEFLKKWGNISDTALSMLQNAFTSGNSGNTELDALAGDIKGQLTQFETDYGGMTKTAMEGAMGDIETKRGLTTEMAGMAKADYAGVTGRAATDVAGQSAMARQEMAREAMSYGVDPTSGKFGALSKKSYLDESRNKVIAMEKARRGEKERSFTATQAAAASINPSESAGIATNLMTQKSNLLGLETTAAKASSDAAIAKANAITGAANVVSGIGEQYGSLGSTMLGLQTASGAGSGEELTRAQQLIANSKSARA